MNPAAASIPPIHKMSVSFIATPRKQGYELHPAKAALQGDITFKTFGAGLQAASVGRIETGMDEHHPASQKADQALRFPLG